MGTWRLAPSGSTQRMAVVSEFHTETKLIVVTSFVFR